jgi:hypothetical protein
MLNGDNIGLITQLINKSRLLEKPESEYNLGISSKNNLEKFNRPKRNQFSTSFARDRLQALNIHYKDNPNLFRNNHSAKENGIDGHGGVGRGQD